MNSRTPFTENRIVSAILGRSHAQTVDEVHGHLPCDETALHHLVHLKSVRRVDLYGESFSDHALDYLAQLPQLEEVRLEETRIEGTGFAKFRCHGSLQRLTMIGDCVSAAGLASIGKITSIKELTLIDSPVTNKQLSREAVALILRNRGLRKLRIIGFAVDDEDMQGIGNLSQLEDLALDGTSIGDATIERTATHRRLTGDSGR